MDAVDVIVVMGPCAPERLRYARRLAAATGRVSIPANRLLAAPDPIARAVELAGRAPGAAGAVVELPSETDPLALIGAMTAARQPVRLSGIVCVADALHLRDDLDRDDHVATPTPHGRALTARALLTARQLEHAAMIVLVNWTSLPTAELSATMALAGHLGPRARLRLHQEALDPLPVEDGCTAAQDRAGWMGVLNEEFDPHLTDPRVSAFRYEQVRPLHPGRLLHLLDERIEPGEHGTVVRSAGFCRLATRPHVVAQWDHVGRTISLTPVAVDDALGAHDELLALGQELAFIGLDLDRDGLVAALDDAALSDAELAAGPEAWAGFPDPFPRWQTARQRDA